MTPRMRSAVRGAATLLLLAGTVQAQEGLRRETVSFPPLGRADIAVTTGQLYLPPGAGPFAAVVILHGCAGIRQNSHRWAEEISRLGMAALVADHFGPRGIDRICERDGGRMVEQRERRRDTYGALDYLSRRSDIDPARIAVMGFSNGGLATINALVPGLNDPTDRRFKAGIALYPDCTGYIGLKVSAPLLILIGERDDWTPPAICQRLIEKLPEGASPVTLEIFPRADHSFDDESQASMYLPRAYNMHAWSNYGATVGYQYAAHQAAVRLVREFLQRQLAAPTSR